MTKTGSAGVSRTGSEAGGTSVGDLEDFALCVEQTTALADYPYAEAVVDNVLTYRTEGLLRPLGDPGERGRLRAELAGALADGPGVVVFRGAFPHEDLVDGATSAFQALITAQHQGNGHAGDHFGQPGMSDRVWNAAEKLALSAPEVFARYYANDILALVGQAWLGPVYQVTSQVNVVNPGAPAQVPHSDYHLGFLTADRLSQYPPHVHRLAPSLTLQGAVAHSDMPRETGPTLYLPYSQRFEPGAAAFNRPEFIDFFERHHVQLPLTKGDAAFFNPALFHAAGHNRSTSVHRMANLLQISSPFGRSMEAINREAMCNAVFPALLALRSTGCDERLVRNAVVATAEGYPFPTNLDRDQPVAGLAPPSQVDLLWTAVTEGWTPEALAGGLRTQAEHRMPGT